MITIDSAALIVSSFYFSGFVAPFAIHSYKIKNYKHEQDVNFEALSEESHTHPEKSERWRNHYQLGIDSTNKKLLYCRYGHYPTQTVLNLEDYNKVSIQEKFHHVQVNKEKRTIVDYVALQFHPKDSKGASKTLEIYDGNMFSDLAGERVLAKKWKGLIESQLTA